jgi:hypothetical protein
MPPSSPSGSPPPPGSLLEVSSHQSPSLVFEKGRPYERIPVVDLSSDEESSAPTVSVADIDASEGVQNDSNDGRTPDRAQGDSSDSGDEVGLP